MIGFENKFVYKLAREEMDRNRHIHTKHIHLLGKSYFLFTGTKISQNMIEILLQSFYSHTRIMTDLRGRSVLAITRI